MDNPRSVSRVATFLTLLFLCSLRAVAANPVFPDQQSISHGAQLYDVYCSACHGRDATSRHSQMYAVGANNSENYSELAEQARQATLAEASAPRKKAPWPSWAGPDPDLKKQAQLDANAESISELTDLINEAHGISSGAKMDKELDKAAAQNTSAVFSPVPGATNLADPRMYFYGTSEQEMFNSIADGTGPGMAGWRSELGNDNAIWDLVNYVRSYWGEEWR